MSEHVTADDLDNLRHALGIDPDRMGRKAPKGWRNYFATTPDDPSFRRLCDAGFARLAGSLNGNRDAVFVATHEGCRAVGMTVKEIEAMEATP